MLKRKLYGIKNQNEPSLLEKANVISSRSFIRPAMFGLELEWTVEVGDGEKARRHLPEEAVEKKNTR